jgi:hypothetical protein
MCIDGLWMMDDGEVSGEQYLIPSFVNGTEIKSLTPKPDTLSIRNSQISSNTWYEMCRALYDAISI